MFHRRNPLNVSSVPFFESMREANLQVKYDHWFTSSYERQFDYYSKRTWLKEHLYIPYVIAAVYLVSMYLGHKWMASRPAYQLRTSLAVWNICLSLFSVVGTLRTLPWFGSFVWTYGLHASCCIEPKVSGVYGFWSWAFVLSKVPELGDTFFIVARKQRLIFLHWFHHVSVLFFVWYSNADNFSIGSWFIVMNYLIHSLMYIHFSLRALKVTVPSLMPLAITSLQLIQMLAGTTITLYAYSQTRRSLVVPCDTHIRTLNISLLLYGSYLMLFLNFFVRRYLSGLVCRVEWSKNSTITTLVRLAVTRGHKKVDKES